MRIVDSLEKTLMLGGIGGRRRGRQRMRWLDGITDSIGMSLSKLRNGWWTGRPGVLRFIGVTKSQTWLSDWTNWLTDTYWRRKWQPTTVLLTGKSHGWRRVVGYSLWGRKESDKTERHYITHTYTLDHVLGWPKISLEFFQPNILQALNLS